MIEKGYAELARRLNKINALQKSIADDLRLELTEDHSSKYIIEITTTAGEILNDLEKIKFNLQDLYYSEDFDRGEEEPNE